MSRLRTLAREPLVGFLLVGAALFVTDAVLAHGAAVDPEEVITIDARTVDELRLRQLAATGHWCEAGKDYPQGVPVGARRGEEGGQLGRQPHLSGNSSQH